MPLPGDSYHIGPASAQAKSPWTAPLLPSSVWRYREDAQLTPETTGIFADEVRKTTCYMCACRCGIDVHVRDNRVTYIEGNRDHPVNKGVLCAKGAAGIKQITSPSRLRAPLRRVGPRGSGAFEEISWDEALTLATSWLKPLRDTAPERLAFFTGRDQSQSFTGWWAQAFGTPNYAAHGGFCSVNMAAGGIYTIGGAFWEFGQPDWDRTELFLLFGVAEDHDSNPIKIGIGKLKARGARIVGVNPIRTGYNAVADDWYGITPGTDGLLILSLVHCLLKAGKIDADYLARWTNAPCLVDEDPNSAQHGLLLKDDEGKPLVLDRATGQPTAFDTPGVRPDLTGTWRHAGVTHRPVFHHLVERYISDTYAPEAVADRTGLAPDRIRGLAAQIAHAAFERSFTVPQPWTDFRGEATRASPPAPSPSTPCAASRPIRTASRPPARSTSCSRSSAPSTPPAPSASSRPTRNPPPPTRARISAPARASRSTARTSATRRAPTTSPFSTTARPPASTRASPGKTRSRPTG
jgi:sulfite dehydrogenase (quinone) subunit SoeA